MVSGSSKRRVQASSTKDRWELIGNLKGQTSDSEADAVRNIVITRSPEKSFISSSAKEEM